MQFPLEMPPGKRIPFWSQIPGRSFRLRADPETASHSGAEIWDTLSAGSQHDKRRGPIPAIRGKGEVASRFVVEEMIESVCNKGVNVEHAIVSTQENLLKKQERENAQSSMKTTLTCLYIEQEDASYYHVGDSRVYHFESGKVKDRTLDHSIPQLLAARGDIKESEIRHHPDRSRLLRVVGTPWDSPKYSVSKKIKIGKKTTFLMCSDGFWELIDEKTMCKLLKKSATPAEWLEEMRKIVLENGRGTNMDNYSAIAVFIR